MKAMRAVSHQDLQGVHIKWWRFDFRARDMLLLRLSTENSTGKTGGGAILQFARFCVVGTSNAVIDFGVLKLGAILGALALSFFGMRFWVFIGKRLSSGPSAQEIGQ